jgi:hypothetical protein
MLCRPPEAVVIDDGQEVLELPRIHQICAERAAVFRRRGNPRSLPSLLDTLCGPGAGGPGVRAPPARAARSSYGPGNTRRSTSSAQPWSSGAVCSGSSRP